MNEFVLVLGAVLPVFGVALIGFVIRRLNWLTEEADQSLLRININLLFPCLIIHAALGNPALSQLGNLILAPIVGFCTVVGGLYMARLLSKATGLKDERAAGTFAVTTGLYNYSYIPLPLSLLLFGQGTAGVLFVYNVGVEIAMWTIGVLLLSGGGTRADWKKIVNAPLVAIVLALGINGLGLHAAIPKPALVAVSWLGQCAIPMSLILIGAVVSDHLSEFHSEHGWRVMGVAILLRIVLLPVAFLTIARYLPASPELKNVIVLQAAMPSAVFPIVMARHYGGDVPTALRVVIATSVVGLVTIPLWIRLGMAWSRGDFSLWE
jgi:predicted permease